MRKVVSLHSIIMRELFLVSHIHIQRFLVSHWLYGSLLTSLYRNTKQKGAKTMRFVGAGVGVEPTGIGL